MNKFLANNTSLAKSFEAVTEVSKLPDVSGFAKALGNAIHPHIHFSMCCAAASGFSVL